MRRFTSRIPDPRPSRAHPEHRKVRKELEKEHGYGWVPPVLLALLGVTLAFDVTKDVEKHEQRHKQEEEEEEERRRQRRRQERDVRSGSHRYRRRNSEDEEGMDGEGGGDGDYDSRDEDRDRERRRRRRRRRSVEQQQQQQQQRRWDAVYDDDDDDDDDDYEDLENGRKVVMARADSLERGEIRDLGKMDGGLDRADQLEKGEGGTDDRDRYEERYEERPRRSIAYDEFDDGRRYRRRRRDEDPGYEYLDYIRGRQALDERRRRPRPRRRSSDW